MEPESRLCPSVLGRSVGIITCTAIMYAAEMTVYFTYHILAGLGSYFHFVLVRILDRAKWETIHTAPLT